MSMELSVLISKSAFYDAFDYLTLLLTSNRFTEDIVWNRVVFVIPPLQATLAMSSPARLFLDRRPCALFLSSQRWGSCP